MWETLLWLLVGAVIGFLPTWFLSNRSHKWELEEKKRERAIASREIRLKEGEEMIKINAREVYYFAQSVFKMIENKKRSQIYDIIKFIGDFFNKWEEADKGKIIYEVSIKSLNDEQLNNAWDKVQESFETYKKYCISLAQSLDREGIKLFQGQREKHIKEEEKTRRQYYSSVAEFFKRINELRSQ